MRIPKPDGLLSVLRILKNYGLFLRVLMSGFVGFAVDSLKGSEGLLRSGFLRIPRDSKGFPEIPEYFQGSLKVPRCSRGLLRPRLGRWMWDPEDSSRCLRVPLDF
eukprot:6219487-Pyramimonas_sp.AAC.1